VNTEDFRIVGTFVGEYRREADGEATFSVKEFRDAERSRL
jgi:hypothetical protein